MSWLARHRAYAAHADPAAAAANFIALVIAWNGPFYPLYIVALAGWPGAQLLLSMLATPCFFAVPWLGRHYPAAGRAALPLIGTANTLWCTKLLGAACGVGLFFLPCLVLAALLFRRRERWIGGIVLVIALAAFLVPGSRLAPILVFAPEDAARLANLNLISVALLLALIALQLAGVLAKLDGIR